MNLLNKFNLQLALVHARLEAINRFNDLQEIVDSYGNVRLVSKKAIFEANEVEYQFSCKCCPDSTIEAHPYLMIDGRVRVYADSIKIGKREPMSTNGIRLDRWKIPSGMGVSLYEKINKEVGDWYQPHNFEDDIDLANDFHPSPPIS